MLLELRTCKESTQRSERDFVVADEINGVRAVMTRQIQCECAVEFEITPWLYTREAHVLEGRLMIESISCRDFPNSAFSSNLCRTRCDKQLMQ